MFNRIARCAIRAPRAILLSMLVVAILGGIFGSSVAAHLGSGGFTDPHAESVIASHVVSDKYPSGAANLVMLITAPDGIDSPAARAAGQHVAAVLRTHADVAGVTSYWNSPPDIAKTLRSNDGRSGLVTARIAGDDTQAANRAGAIAAALVNTTGSVTVRAGGEAINYHEITGQVAKDLTQAELLAIPITATLLIWVFGSVVAATIPLAVGIASILLTMGILRVLAALTELSVFAMNITVALGLALAIDYSLFTVNRFREELSRGGTVEDAVMRTVCTAGRTVLFAALPIALSLSTLALFPPYVMRSFAYAGVCTVAAVVFASLFAVPAALVLLGRRVDALDTRVLVRKLAGQSRRKQQNDDRGLIYRAVMIVTRFPGLAAVVAISFLLVLGSPFLSVKFGYNDDRVIGSQAQSRQVGDVLRSDFSVNAATTLYAVLPEYSGQPRDIAAYAQELSRVDGVTMVTSPGGAFSQGLPIGPPAPQMAMPAATFITIASRLDPFSQAATKQLAQLRAVHQPGKTMFAGPAALNVDSLESLSTRLPLALALIALATYVVLFAFTRSAVLPLKALVLNTLSLCATFGAMVWVFQDGHLTQWLGCTATGYLTPPLPILMFCLAFGISMDYEVFILARIREEWVGSVGTPADNTRAVAVGVARTGRIITAAAALMAVVFSAIVSSKVSFMQMFGLGLTLMVVVDSGIVRMILVPAFMQLMGRLNWWAPRRIRCGGVAIELTDGAAADLQAPGSDEDNTLARTSS